MHHEYYPDRYYLTIGSHEPVLRVENGDSVATLTLDAGGRDLNGETKSERGNPQTGPIFVDGAKVGTVLAVTLEHVWPNREHGFCRPRIAPNVLEPGHDTGLYDNEPFDFVLDFQSKTASIANPSKGLKSLKVPIRPMIGCFGVAPDRGQAISTATSGPHGGNMDYRGFEPGVTAYFPVFVEGALFHIGDGHAGQSDGEILGTGIEVPMDVTFSFKVIEGRKIDWPRGQNKEYIFTVGNARPLDEALQHASSEMLRWLTDDYGLSLPDANILLGTYVEYDVGNVFDPAYTMVCKLPKAVLPEPVSGALLG